MPSKCLYCHQEFKGRSDKIYCSTDCKNAFNNDRRSQKEAAVITINKQLRKNWKIIQRMNPQGKSTVRKQYLIDLGFDFNYFTNIYKSNKGQVYFFYYHVGLTEISNTHVCIVNWQEYMNFYKLPIGLIKSK